MAKFFILSFDGGGIRGIFSAKLMALIEQQFTLPKFNLCAGTSTGSILASAYCCGIEFDHMVKLYRGVGAKIFRRRFFLGPRLLEKAIMSPYDNARLLAVLRTVFSKTVLENLPVPIIIPTTNLEDTQPFIFKSYEGQAKNTYLFKAILASCCAPTYFDPYTIHGKLLADGGMWANNPSLIAISEAIRQFNADIKDIYLLSLGSGHFTKCYDKQTANWGIINGWKIRTLVEFSSSLQSESIYQTALNMLGPDHVLRLNYEHDAIISPDQFTANAYLEELAAVCFKKNKQRIKRFLTV